MPVQIFNNPETGAILIPLNKEEVGLSSEAQAIEFMGKVFVLKNEMHITIVGRALGQQLKATIETNSNLKRQLDLAVNKTDWSYTIKDKLYHVSKEKREKDLNGNINILPAESIICEVEVAGIREFYNNLSTLLKKELAAPPTHVTLYTYQDPIGIGIASISEFAEYVVREVSPQELHRLRGYGSGGEL